MSTHTHWPKKVEVLLPYGAQKDMFPVLKNSMLGHF